MLKLSIVIPVYNVERYIARCLDSVFDQDIPESEYEVICVNDCSPDCSVNIIENYLVCHSNLKLINLPENRGSGYARSIALNNACGEYIWFVDADDTVYSNVFHQLFKYCNKKELDILFFNYKVVEEESGIAKYTDKFNNSGVLSGEEFVDREFKGSLTQLSIVWKSLYSRKFIFENRINFPNMRISQDAIFAWRAIIKAQRVESITERFYCFRPNPYSATATTNISVEKSYSKFILFAVEVAKILDEYKLHGSIRKSLVNGIKWGMMSFINFTKSQNFETRVKIYKVLRSDYRQVIALKHFFSKKDYLFFMGLKMPIIIWNHIINYIK